MNVKVYMAGRVSRRPVLQEWSDDLEAAGFEIVSRWSIRDTDHAVPKGMKSEQAPPEERVRFAREDVEDIEKCHIVVSIMEEPRNDSRGGRHIEFGYAMAKEKELYIVGPKETVFHELPEVHSFDDWQSCFRAILKKYTSSARPVLDGCARQRTKLG